MPYRVGSGSVKAEPGDAFKVPGVPRDNYKSMVESCRRDQDVRVTDHLSGAPKFTADSCESLDDCLVQGEDIDIPEKPSQRPFVALRVTAEVNALIQFTERHEADGQTISRQARE